MGLSREKRDEWDPYTTSYFTEHSDDRLCPGVEVLGFARQFDNATMNCDAHADIQDDDDQHRTQEKEKCAQLIHRPVRRNSVIQHGAEGGFCYLVR
jgi:hypothetical protein